MQERSQVHSLVWSSSCGNRQGFAGRLQCGILCPSPKAVACEVNLMQADLSESSAVIWWHLGNGLVLAFLSYRRSRFVQASHQGCFAPPYRMKSLRWPLVQPQCQGKRFATTTLPLCQGRLGCWRRDADKSQGTSVEKDSRRKTIHEQVRKETGRKDSKGFWRL